MALKRDASNASLAGIAYSRMFKLILFSHFSQQSHDILKHANKSTINDDSKEAFYLQSFQEVMRLIGADHPHPEDNYLLPEVLRKVYLAFDCMYNGGRNSHATDIQSKWVDEQLILLPNHLLSFGEKTKSVWLYKKIIRTRPSLLRYLQTYRFPARCIARTNLISRIRGMRINQRDVGTMKHEPD